MIYNQCNKKAYATISGEEFILKINSYTKGKVLLMIFILSRDINEISVSLVTKYFYPVNWQFKYKNEKSYWIYRHTSGRGIHQTTDIDDWLITIIKLGYTGSIVQQIAYMLEVYYK